MVAIVVANDYFLHYQVTGTDERQPSHTAPSRRRLPFYFLLNIED
jgi:hypothetical protein